MKSLLDRYFDKKYGAIITPDVGFVDEILPEVYDMVYNHYNKIIKHEMYPVELLEKYIVYMLNDRFYQYSKNHDIPKIHFTLNDKDTKNEVAPGIVKGIHSYGAPDISYITIYLNRGIYLMPYFIDKDRNDIFTKGLKSVLSHEMVHSEQTKRRRENIDPEEWYNIVQREKGLDLEHKDSLARKQEIMAYADSIINNLINEGANANQIENFLKRPYSYMGYPEATRAYWMYAASFGRGSKIMKLLEKRMYEYAKERGLLNG